jgi:thiamine-phosphate pyrophosphorylase
VLLYYITDRTQFEGPEARQRELLLQSIARAGKAGVDFLQLREKDLTARDLEHLANEAVGIVKQAREDGSRTKLLINSRIDVAIAAGADGVHLRADDMNAGDARALFAKCGVMKPTIGVSCHSADAVALAESHGADFAIVGPVFEKRGFGAATSGLQLLRNSCDRPAIAGAKMPVLALGGVTLGNAASCMDAGASGIAAIRLFQSEEVEQRVAQLRAIAKPLAKERPAYPYGK